MLIQVTSQVEKAIGKYKELGERLRVLKAEEDLFKSFIMDFLADNMSIAKGGKKLVSWETRKYTRFDVKGFKKDYPDMYDAYLGNVDSREFRVF
jgi:hypothetical protein